MLPSSCLSRSLVLKFPDGSCKEVCPQAYAKAHLRGHTYYDKIVRQMKEGAMNGGSNMFAKHCAIKPSAIKDLLAAGKGFRMKLTTAEFTAVTLPGTLRALFTAAWMKEFFRLTGM